jgi:hypothetical protein
MDCLCVLSLPQRSYSILKCLNKVSWPHLNELKIKESSSSYNFSGRLLVDTDDEFKLTLEFGRMDEDMAQDVSQFVKLMGVFSLERKIFHLCRL